MGIKRLLMDVPRTGLLSWKTGSRQRTLWSHSFDRGHSRISFCSQSLFVWMIDEKQMKQGIHPVWTQGPRSMLEFSSWWLISTVNRANERTMAHNFLSKDYTGGHNITKVDSILKDRCVGRGQEAQASTTVQHRYSCGGLCNHLLHQNFTSYG